MQNIRNYILEMAIPSTYKIEYDIYDKINKLFNELFKDFIKDKDITVSEAWNKVAKKYKKIVYLRDGVRYILISDNYLSDTPSYIVNEFKNKKHSFIFLQIQDDLVPNDIRLSSYMNGALSIRVSSKLLVNDFIYFIKSQSLIKDIQHELIHILDTQSKIYKRFYKSPDEGAENYASHPYEVLAYSSDIIEKIPKNIVYTKKNIEIALRKAILDSKLAEILKNKILSNKRIFNNYQDVIVDTLINNGRYSGPRPFSQRVRSLVNPIKFTARGIIGK